jgi:hypothetical protein
VIVVSLLTGASIVHNIYKPDMVSCWFLSFSLVVMHTSYSMTTCFFFLLNFFFCRLFHPLRVWIVAVTTTRRAEYKHRMLEAEHGNPGCRDWFFLSFSMYCKIAYFSDIKIAWVWITVCASEFWCLPSYLWHGKERCEKI